MTKDEAILATYKRGFKYPQNPSMISWEKAQAAMDAYAASEVEKAEENTELLRKRKNGHIDLLQKELAAKDAEIAALQMQIRVEGAVNNAEIKRLMEGIRKAFSEINGYENMYRTDQYRMAMETIEALKALLSPSEESSPDPVILCPKCDGNRLEVIGVGVNAGTLYQCWACNHEWEDED